MCRNAGVPVFVPKSCFQFRISHRQHNAHIELGNCRNSLRLIPMINHNGVYGGARGQPSPIQLILPWSIHTIQTIGERAYPIVVPPTFRAKGNFSKFNSLHLARVPVDSLFPFARKFRRPTVLEILNCITPRAFVDGSFFAVTPIDALHSLHPDGNNGGQVIQL